MKLNNRGTRSPEEITGSNNPLPGLYHVVLKSVDESLSKYAKAIVTEWQVLNGTVPGQAGRILREFFSIAESGVDRIRKLAMYLGLLGPDEERDVLFRDAVGRQLIIEIEDHEYSGKSYRRMSYLGFWSVGHPRVAHVPLDQAAAKLAAGVVSTGGSDARKPSAQPARAGDPWANL